MSTHQVLAISCCLAPLVFSGQSFGADDELTGCLKNGRLAQLQPGDEPIGSSCRGKGDQVTIPASSFDDAISRFSIRAKVSRGGADHFPVDGNFDFSLVCRNPEVTTDIGTSNSAGLRLTSTVQGRVASIRSSVSPPLSFTTITDDPGDADWYVREISFDAVSRTDDGLFVALKVTRGYVAYGPEYDGGCLLFVEGEIIELPPPPFE